MQINPPDIERMVWLLDYDSDDEGFIYCNPMIYIASSIDETVSKICCFCIHEGLPVPEQILDKALQKIGLTYRQLWKKVQVLCHYNMGAYNHYFTIDKWESLMSTIPMVGLTEGDWFSAWNKGD